MNQEPWPRNNDTTTDENGDPNPQLRFVGINSDNPLLDDSEASRELLQQKLRFYFMSPIDKWRTKRRFPFKLIFQLLKIVFVTGQLVNFGTEMSHYMAQDDHIKNAFRNILLDDWDQTREVVAYPPATGDYAIYTSEHFYSSLDFAVRKYSNLTRLSVGAFGFPAPDYPRLIFQQTYFCHRQLDPSTLSYRDVSGQSTLATKTLIIDRLYPVGDPRWWTEYHTENYFAKNNFSIAFDTIVKLKLILPMRTILFEEETMPRCFDLNSTISYNNRDHDALIKVKLKVNRVAQPCNRINNDNSSSSSPVYPQAAGNIMALNSTVIIFCIISSLLCCRSLFRGQLLRRETQRYFQQQQEQWILSLDDQLQFIDLGLVMILINDLLIIIGTGMKIRMESSDSVDSQLYSQCSLFLGIGNLLVWLGLLRYFTYFRSYNILIVTLKKSMPNMLRFLLCAALVYGGFCFCGWVVLGPHHLKFRTLSSTSECLFSLINGDDMFATFFSTDVKKYSVIWWFSRAYLYLFISLFIYVIVSLFIAIVLDAYETVRDSYNAEQQQELTEQTSPLKKFIDEYPIENFDGRFYNNSILDQIQHFFRSANN